MEGVYEPENLRVGASNAAFTYFLEGVTYEAAGGLSADAKKGGLDGLIRDLVQVQTDIEDPGFTDLIRPTTKAIDIYATSAMPDLENRLAPYNVIVHEYMDGSTKIALQMPSYSSDPREISERFTTTPGIFVSADGNEIDFRELPTEIVDRYFRKLSDYGPLELADAFFAMAYDIGPHDIPQRLHTTETRMEIDNGVRIIRQDAA